MNAVSRVLFVTEAVSAAGPSQGSLPEKLCLKRGVQAAVLKCFTTRALLLCFQCAHAGAALLSQAASLTPGVQTELLLLALSTAGLSLVPR